MTRHTKAIGDRTEAHVFVALFETFETVLVPWGENQRHDLVVEDECHDLHRIQAKTGRLRDGVVRFNTCSSTYHHPANQGTKHYNHDYRGDAEYFAVYCPGTEAVYLVPVDEVGTREACLRVEPTRNGQRRGIRFAGDYQIHPPG